MPRHMVFDKLRELFDESFATVDGVRCIKVVEDFMHPDPRWIPYTTGMEAKILSQADEYFYEYAPSQGFIPPEISLQTMEMIRLEISSVHEIDTFLELVKDCDWDGIDRLTTLGKCIGLQGPDSYVSAIGKMLVMGPIERHLHPFVQQVIPTIIGKQGIGKGRTLKAITLDEGDCTRHATILSLDQQHTGRMLMQMTGQAAITELAELDSILWDSKSGFVKAIFDNEGFKVDKKYAAEPEMMKFRCFFVATTNHEQVLTDRTGNRRFATVHMTEQPSNLDRDDTDTESPICLWEHPGYVMQLLAQGYHEIVTEKKSYADGIDEEFKATSRAMAEAALVDIPGMSVIIGCIQDEVRKHGPLDDIKIRWVILEKTVRAAAYGHYYTPEITRALREFKAAPEVYGCSYGTQYIEGNRAKGIRITDRRKLESY